MADLTPELQAVVDAAIRSPESEGLFQALLMLLENAPDSKIVAAALSQFSPSTCANPRLRRRYGLQIQSKEKPRQFCRGFSPDKYSLRQLPVGSGTSTPSFASCSLTHWTFW